MNLKLLLYDYNKFNICILNICYNITYLYYYNNIYNNNLFYIHDAGVGDIVLYYTVLL